METASPVCLCLVHPFKMNYLVENKEASVRQCKGRCWHLQPADKDGPRDTNSSSFCVQKINMFWHQHLDWSLVPVFFFQGAWQFGLPTERSARTHRHTHCFGGGAFFLEPFLRLFFSRPCGALLIVGKEGSDITKPEPFGEVSQSARQWQGSPVTV